MPRGRQARNRRSTTRAATIGAKGVGKALGTDAAIAEFPGLETLIAAATGGSFKLGDRTEAWDGGAAQKSYELPGDGDCYMWKDPDGDPAVKGTYKLPFVSKDGGKHAVWKGITTIAGVLSGSMGGVKGIPDGDVAKIKTAVEGYYEKAATQYKDDSIKPPWEADESKGENAAMLMALAEMESPVHPDRIEDGIVFFDGPDDVDARDAAMLEYGDRFAFWDEQFGGKPNQGTDKDKRLKKNKGEAAMGGKCSECGHGATAHGGEDNDGACGMNNCSCDGFVGKGEAAADSMSDTCAGCSHDQDMHEGDDHMGACDMEDCDCQGFKERVDEANITASQITLAIVDHGDRDPFDLVVDGLPPEHAAIVKLRLENFTVVQPLVADSIHTPGDMEDTLPPEHKPGQRTPPRRRGPKAPDAPNNATSSGPMAWDAMIVPEGTLTDDGRCMAPGSITWRELPLTLMAMIETTEGGHIGAQLCGRIDKIWRDEASGTIRASGVFDDGEYGSEIARLVGDRTLTGVSVDLAIQDYEVGPKSDYFDEDGKWAPQETASEAPSIIDLLLGENSGDPTIFVVTDAVIGMTTVCPFPAFADAKIDVANSLSAGANHQIPGLWTLTQQGGFTVRPLRVTEAPILDVDVDYAAMTEEERLEAYDALVVGGLSDGEARGTVWPEQPLTASAAEAGLAPLKPPAEWFANPEFEELTALTVTDDGRIYGHAWSWDTCHTAFPDACVTAPASEHEYAYFHLGEIECEEGERITCGKITFDTGHAGQKLSRADATAHYDHTGAVVADIVVGEDEFGGWFSGAVRPDVPAEKVRALRAAVLSGDWRNVSNVNGGGNLELVALLAVNVPGFPVPRGPRASVIVASGRNEIQSLVAAGLHRGLPDDTASLEEDVKARLQEMAEAASSRRYALEQSFRELADRAAA